LNQDSFERKSLVESWDKIAVRYFARYQRHPFANKLKQSAYPFLVNFTKSIEKLGLNRKPMLVEKTLSTELSDGWVLRGRVDAVWQHGAPTDGNGGGIIEVVDWKSSRGAKGEAALRQDIQARIYAWLAMQVYDVDRVLFTMHYVMRNKRTSVMFQRDELSGIEEQFTEAAMKISSENFTKADDSRCTTCAYTLAGKPCEGLSVFNN
jgi:hypothetical protein